MKVIHHHDVSPKLVKFGVTSKEGILNQGRNLRLTKPSRASLGFIKDRIKFPEQFLVLIQFEFRDPFGRCSGFPDFTLD